MMATKRTAAIRYWVMARTPSVLTVRVYRELYGTPPGGQDPGGRLSYVDTPGNWGISPV